MIVRISSVADKGNLLKERLVLRAALSTDIGHFVVLQTGYAEDGVTTEIHHSYWFPYKSIAAGDLVVLYSKEGKDREKMLDGGRKAHFFYWGLSSAIWNLGNRAPVLLYAPEWESKAPSEL